MFDPNKIDTITISLASPETIANWAYKQKAGVKGHDKPWGHGEITDNNYRQKEDASIYSQPIFGPEEDYTCACTSKTINPYTIKRLIRKGTVCKKCGVAISSSRLRRERFGYIDFAYPVANPLYVGKIAKLLDVTETALKSVLDYKSILVISSKTVRVPNTTEDGEPYELAMQIPVAKVEAFLEQFTTLEADTDTVITKGTGGEIVLKLLKLYTRNLLVYLRDNLAPTKHNQDRLELIQTFLASSGVKPEFMMLQNLPVLPPDFRPNSVVGNMIYPNPLNEVYASIVSVNKELQKAEKPLSPLYYLDGRKMQRYVNALYQQKYADVIRGLKNYKALVTGLSKKSGIFRRNLLGKRVNYSARSVILADPKLRFDQCGIPKRIALELFRPFIINILCQNKTVKQIKDAENLVNLAIEHADDFVLEIKVSDIPGQSAFNALQKLLDKESDNCPVVLLNRTPTLHKLGIQAFYPIIGNDRAIHLHPLVCAGFNADFDGDTMAIHLPLTDKAQAEARKYMLASKNILSPCTGKPIAVPTQDIVLGLYYNTLGKETDGDKYKPYTKKSLAQKIDDEYDPEKPDKTALELDKYKTMGYSAATYAGLSIAATDFPEPTPHTKQEYIRKVEAKLEKLDMSKEEDLYIEQWCDVANKLYQELKESDIDNMDSSFRLIADSGARGNDEQFKQICVMRGLFKDTKQNIIPAPIKSSLMDGMSSLEYFISCHGTRKGLTDTAINTAESGYLTRRLIYATQEVTITDDDCTESIADIPFIEFPAPKPDSDECKELNQRIIGRYLAKQTADFKVNTLITPDIAEKVLDSSVRHEKPIRIRSALTCRCKKGICQKCYGQDPATRLPVKFGTPVGIIAAQSLSEPTTQFVMRTFHNGGSASTQDITDSMPDLMNHYDNNSRLNLQELLDDSGIEAFRLYMLNKLKAIYNDNGVDIKDVHIEVILRQMLEKQSDGKYRIRSVKECAVDDPGFLKAASFEKTGVTLAEAAIKSKSDSLETVAACVMVGKKPHILIQ